MYLDFFGFDEPPFSITPDPKFVFLSQKHQESLAHLVYGITRGGGAGFVQLTGEVGTGKTTISRLLLEQIPEKTNIALILNPVITPLELIQNICKELKVSMRGIKSKLNTLIDKLNTYLLNAWSNGENTVVIIDEAQNLPRDTLEQLRLLTNLETDKQKLLQIILIGQPELRDTMRRNDLRQLAQRVTARYHLMPLDSDETLKYLQHRITVAGGNKNIVNKSIANKIHQYTAGVPRLINILTDRALLASYTETSEKIQKKHIKIAAIEVLPNSEKIANKAQLKTLLIAFILLAFVITGYQFLQNFNQVKISTNNIKSISNNVISPKIILNSPQKTLIASVSDSWKEYFDLWDAKNDKNWNKIACPNSIDTGMACLRRQGNFNQIVKINHPVLMQIDDNQLVLIKSIEQGKILIFSQVNKDVWVDKNTLLDQWLGTYFILWPMPAELLTTIDAKALNQWTQEMVNTISVDNIPTKQIKAWVIAFQKQHGLLADGIIGSETQMLLSLMAYSGPTLKQRPHKL